MLSTARKRGKKLSADDFRRNKKAFERFFGKLAVKDAQFNGRAELSIIFFFLKVKPTGVDVLQNSGDYYPKIIGRVESRNAMWASVQVYLRS